MINYIFLDIDNVLNEPSSNSQSPDGYLGIDDEKVECLGKIAEALNAKIILSSSWKNELDENLRPISKDGKYMLNKFKYKGNFSLAGKIIDITEFKRGESILQFLKDKNVGSYIIIDDFEFDFNSFEEIKTHVVKTEYGIFTASAFCNNPAKEVLDCLNVIENFKENIKKLSDDLTL